jgi:hypothetical protein
MIRLRGDGRRAKANASSESSVKATERGAVRLLAFGKASTIRAGAAVTLHQGLGGFSPLEMVCNCIYYITVEDAITTKVVLLPI